MEISPVNEWREFYLNEMRYALLNLKGKKWSRVQMDKYED
jgi:hypothetical protein